MKTHTHRGHCQYCLRVQAIDMQTGLIAKHGYHVASGYFQGVCRGSHAPTLHIERILTDLLIKQCIADSVSHATMAAGYQSGKCVPEKAASGKVIKTQKVGRSSGRVYYSHEDEYVPFDQAPAEHQARAIQREIWHHTNTARAAHDHAKKLTEWAGKITGKVEAYRVEDIDAVAWQVGETVRIGGKSGFNALIEAIEDRPYTTRGFRRGSEVITCPHARITSPIRPEVRSRTGVIERMARGAAILWEPLRHIKRPPSALAKSLKKAGLL